MNAPIPFLGEASALLAAIAWAVALALFKAWGEGVSALALNLAKNGIAVTGLLLAILFLQPPFPGAQAPYLMLVLSGIIGIAVSDTLVLAGMARVGTALTAASFCISAPISAIWAGIAYHEKLSAGEIAGISIALGATASVAWLGMSAREHREVHEHRRRFEVGLLFLFLAQLANSVGIVLGHRALQDMDVLYGTLVRSVPAILLLLPATLWTARRGERKRLPRRNAVMLALGCVVGTLIGLVLMSMGLKYARAGIAASLNATYPIWAIPLSRLFLKERLTAPMIGLMLLAVAGIALLFLT